MNKTRFISIIAIGLLFSNLMLLAFILMHRPQGPHGRPGGPEGRGGPRNIIIDRLGFDDKQVKEYDKLIQWHRQHIDEKDGEIRVLKNKLYGTLTMENQQSTRDSLITAIGNVQKEIEEIHYKHFEDIRKLCRQDQLERYNDLTRDIASLFAPPHPPKPGGR